MLREDTERIFAQRVRLMRLRRGLSMRQLATCAGIAYQTLYKIEHGLLKASKLYVAANLARALQINLDFLAGLYHESERDMRDGEL